MSQYYVSRKDELPPSYVSFIEFYDGWEGFPAGGDEYVILWSRQSIQDNYEWYELDKYLDSYWFPIGTNGGLELLCFDLSSDDDTIYWLPLIGMSSDSPIVQYSFVDLARRIERSG